MSKANGRANFSFTEALALIPHETEKCLLRTENGNRIKVDRKQKCRECFCSEYQGKVIDTFHCSCKSCTV